MAPSTPSLYATTKLLRLLRKVKDRLQARIKNTQSVKSSEHSQYTSLKTKTYKSVVSTVKSYSRQGRGLAPRAFVTKSQRETDLLSLLKNLDIHAQCDNASLIEIATQDCLFLKYDSFVAQSVKNIDQLYCILDLSTALLDRLRILSGSSGQRYLNTHDDSLPGGDLKCSKFLANLEHLLRCLRQIALDAIVRYYLDLVEVHIQHWHDYWQQRKRIGEGWFAEWPNGHRPLSTTWPWNIKPSLLVLWGVCWMFYASSDSRGMNSGRTYRAGENVPSESFRTGQQFGLGQIRQPQPQRTTNSSNDWSSPATYQNPSWLHAQAVTNTQHASGGIPEYQTSQTSVPTESYISTTSNVSTDLFPASTNQWPYCQGINQDPPLAYAPSYTPWQPSYTSAVTTTPQKFGPSTPLLSYGPQPQQQNNSQPSVGAAANLGFGLGLNLRNMQDYPSPHSDVSGQTTSSCLSILPGPMMDPTSNMVPRDSPSSLMESSPSRRGSGKSQEAPRNAEGLLYCNHPNCAQDPPVFSRKCEWTKHMDKHNRPHKCEEPECEKIRGFTYSGGLLRHQREVHHQHGGPKASCHCPHKDCKRSTGAGFSRRENLLEHLRRVHRDVGTEENAEAQDDESSTARDAAVGASSKPQSSRKRRKATAPDESGGGGGGEEGGNDEQEGELEKEVKRLRKELQEKDERLRRVEAMMEQFQQNASQQQQGGQATQHGR